MINTPKFCVCNIQQQHQKYKENSRLHKTISRSVRMNGLGKGSPKHLRKFLRDIKVFRKLQRQGKLPYDFRRLSPGVTTIIGLFILRVRSDVVVKELQEYPDAVTLCTREDKYNDGPHYPADIYITERKNNEAMTLSSCYYIVRDVFKYSEPYRARVITIIAIKHPRQG